MCMRSRYLLAIMAILMLVSFTAAELPTGTTFSYSDTSGNTYEGRVIQNLNLAGIPLVIVDTDLPTFLEFEYDFFFDVDNNDLEWANVSIGVAEADLNLILFAENGVPIGVSGDLDLYVSVKLKLPSGFLISGDLVINGSVAPFLNNIGDFAGKLEAGEDASLVTGYNLSSDSYDIDLAYTLSFTYSETGVVVNFANPEVDLVLTGSTSFDNLKELHADADEAELVVEDLTGDEISSTVDTPAFLNSTDIVEATLGETLPSSLTINTLGGTSYVLSLDTVSIPESNEQTGNNQLPFAVSMFLAIPILGYFRKNKKFI